MNYKTAKWQPGELTYTELVALTREQSEKALEEYERWDEPTIVETPTQRRLRIDRLMGRCTRCHEPSEGRSICLDCQRVRSEKQGRTRKYTCQNCKKEGHSSRGCLERSDRP